jgi:hypothetical protein
MKHFQIYCGEFRIVVIARVKFTYNANDDGKLDNDKYKILRINRTTPFQLRIEEDSHLYSQIDMNKTIAMLSTTYKVHGGLKNLGKACAILGLIDCVFVIFIIGFIKSVIGYICVFVQDARKV